ncbi:hypothetical protein Tco_1494056 [Tanacetum coccineum]
MAFVSSSNNSTSNSNEAVNAAHRVYYASTNLKWSTTTATRGDILLGSAELQENQDNKNKKKLKKECACGKNLHHTLVSCDGLGGYDWSDQAEEGPNYAPMAYSFSSFDSDPVVENIKAMSSEEEPKVVRKNNDALIIEEWVSDKTDVKEPNKKQRAIAGYVLKRQSLSSDYKLWNNRLNCAIPLFYLPLSFANTLTTAARLNDGAEFPGSMRNGYFSVSMYTQADAIVSKLQLSGAHEKDAEPRFLTASDTECPVVLPTLYFIGSKLSDEVVQSF